MKIFSKTTENNKQIKKEIYRAGIDRNNGPYYDPKDIHAHQWIFGSIVPQNSHSEILKESESVKKIYNVNYCFVCHEIKSEIDLINNTKITSVYKIDNLQQDIPIQQGLSTNLNSFEKSMCITDNEYNNNNNNNNNSKINNNKVNYSDTLDKLIHSNLFIIPNITNINDNSIMFSYSKSNQ